MSRSVPSIKTPVPDRQAPAPFSPPCAPANAIAVQAGAIDDVTGCWRCDEPATQLDEDAAPRRLVDQGVEHRGVDDVHVLVAVHDPQHVAGRVAE